MPPLACAIRFAAYAYADAGGFRRRRCCHCCRFRRLFRRHDAAAAFATLSTLMPSPRHAAGCLRCHAATLTRCCLPRCLLIFRHAIRCPLRSLLRRDATSLMFFISIFRRYAADATPFCRSAPCLILCYATPCRCYMLMPPCLLQLRHAAPDAAADMPALQRYESHVMSARLHHAMLRCCRYRYMPRMPLLIDAACTPSSRGCRHDAISRLSCFLSLL